MPPVLTSARLRLRIAVTLLASTVGLLFLVGGGIGPTGAEFSGPILPTTESTEPPPTSATVVPTTAATTTTMFVPTTTFTPTTARSVQTSSATSLQTSTSTSTTPESTTTSAPGRDLLVAGDGTDGAESTTTTSTIPASEAGDGGVSESTTLWLIVAGLVAIALLIGLWTYRYWVTTRPAPAEADPADSGSSRRRPGGDDPSTVF